MHGEDDQIVPIEFGARSPCGSSKGAREIYYPGTPHGITAAMQDRVNADLLSFLRC